MKLGVEIDVKKTGNGFEVSVAGLRRISSEADGATGHLNRLDKELSEGGKLAQGFAEGLENVIVGFGKAAALAVALAPAAALAKGLQVGVEFNAMLESSQIGLASIIAQTSDLTDEEGKRLKGVEEFNSAQAIGVEMQRDLKQAAMETAATYEQLVTGMQAVLSAHEGAFDSKQIVAFTKELSQAAAAIDPILLREGAFAQEVRGVLEGDLSRASRLARILYADFAGSAADLKKKLQELKEQGKLFDFLHERLESFSIGGEKSMNTLNTSMSNFQDFMQQAFGEGTQELTRALAQSLNSIVEEFTYVDDSGHRAFDKDLIQGIKDTAEALIDLIGFITDAIRLFKEWKDIGHEFMKPPDREEWNHVTDLISAKRRELEMGTWTAQERAQIEKEIASLEKYAAQLWTKIIPTSPQGQGMAAQLLQQAAGTAKLEGFNPMNQAAYGQRLLDLANKDAKQYLATLREIHKAAKDAVVTPMEVAQAFERARREMAKGVKIGTLHPRETDTGKAAEAEAKRLEEVRKAEEALRQFINAQENSLAMTRLNTDAVTAETDVLKARNALEELASRTTGDRLQQLRQQLVLREKLTQAERDRAGVEALQRATAEEFRHLEALAKVNELEARLRREVDEFDNTHGKKGTSPEEAARQQELINRARENENDQYFANYKLLGAQTEQAMMAISLKSTHDRNDLILQEWQETNRHMLALYDDLNSAFVDGARQTIRALFDSTDLQSGFEALLDGIKQSWANMLADMLADWLKMLKQRATGTPDFVDEHGRLWTGMKPDPNAQALYGGIVGAATAYGLYQSGRNGATPGENAIGGMFQGASVGGSFGGIPGAVIGLIIGGVFGALTGKEKSGFRITSVGGQLTVTGGGSATEADVQDALHGINIMIANTRAQMLELLDAFPSEMMKSLLGQLDAVTEGDLFGNFDIGKQRWKNWLSKQFGFLGKAMRGMLSPEELKRWTEVELPNMMFDAFAPIIEGGLRELGVTEQKIKELLSKGPGFDAKEALQKLRDYVKVLVGFIDSDEFNKLGSADLMSRAIEKVGETPIQAIRRIGEEIKSLADGFDTLTTDEQVKRGEQILGLEQQREQAVLQYLYQIKQAQDALFKSIDSQIHEIDLGEMGPFAQLAQLQTDLVGVMGKIGSAATPDELSALGTEYQTLVGRVYELSVRLPQEINNLIDGFKGLDDLLAPERSPLQRLADLQTKIGDAYTRMSEASTPDEQLAAARELYGLVQERYQLEREMLNEINTVLEGINKTIDSTIHDFELQGRITEAERRGATPEEIANIQVEDLMGQQRSLRERLAGATTAQEINDIVTEMNRNAQQLFELMGRTPEAARQLTTMLQDVRNIARQRLIELTNEITSHDRDNQTRIDNAITGLTDALGKIPTAAEAAKAALEELREALRARFTQLTDEVIEANRNILGTIENILNILRTGLEGIFDPTPGEPGNPGKPEKPGGGDQPGTNSMANAYNPPTDAVQPQSVFITNDIGDTNVYVTLAGTAEALIDSVVARSEMAARTTAARAAALASRRRSGF